MSDVKLRESLIVKGWWSIGRRHDISYRTFKNEHSRPMGQGSCLVLRIFQGGRGEGGEQGLKIGGAIW